MFALIQIAGTGYGDTLKSSTRKNPFLGSTRLKDLGNVARESRRNKMSPWSDWICGDRKDLNSYSHLSLYKTMLLIEFL